VRQQLIEVAFDVRGVVITTPVIASRWGTRQPWPRPTWTSRQRL